MLSINQQITQKQFSKTPTKITEEIIQFCKEVTREQAPLFVNISQAETSVQSECYYNVSHHVQKYGGEITYGWAIWIWEGVFIEAEHHSVWKNNDTIIDITPPIHDENRILFLPDPSKFYDFNTNARFGNIRKSLSNSLTVNQWINLCENEFKFMERHRVGKNYHVPQDQYKQIISLKSDYWLRMIIEQHTLRKRNQLCICTSGKKFKKCCGPLIY